MKRLFFFLFQFFIFFPALSLAATAYYVNPEAPNGGNGSFSRPWNSISQVNSHKFSTGDDVYFKAGTITPINPNQRLFVTWDGTLENPVVIGAYYGEGLFGLNGKERPIISGLVGGKRTGGTLHVGAIHYSKPDAVGYIHVVDLHVTGVIGQGVTLHGRLGVAGDGNSIEHCRVENVRTTNTGSMGVGLYQTFHSVVENCIVEDPNQDLTNYAAGCAIDIGALQQEGRSKYNTVRGCIVARGYEGIGAYKGPLYTTIENNIVYDCRTYHIYAANSRHGIIRNNIVYGTKSSRGGAHSGGGIVVDNESHNPNVVGINVTGNWEIYGNHVAAVGSGIVLLNNGHIFGTYQKNNLIYNNILVDNDHNFRFNHDQYGEWHDNLVSENYSFIFSNGVHVNKTTFRGVDWKNNFFNSPVSGGVGSSLMNVDSNFNLVKTNEWRTLPPGGVDRSFFQFTNEIETSLSPPTIIDVTH